MWCQVGLRLMSEAGGQSTDALGTRLRSVLLKVMVWTGEEGILLRFGDFLLVGLHPSQVGLAESLCRMWLADCS